MKITFELSDRDLRYFRRLMSQVRAGSREADEQSLVAAARDMIHEIRHYSRATQFLLTRLERMERLVEMIEDVEWRLRGRDRRRVLDALAYFAEGEDLVPDRVPGLGYLDDAVMIELIAQDLRHEIEAYEDFVAFREGRSPGRPRVGHPTPRLAPRRDQLLSRMRRRTSGGRGRSVL